jgi:hypothetical protein
VVQILTYEKLLKNIKNQVLLAELVLLVIAMKCMKDKFRRILTELLI